MNLHGKTNDELLAMRDAIDRQLALNYAAKKKAVPPIPVVAPPHPDLAVFDRKVTPLPIAQRRILMWADNAWLLCDWFPRTETSKADKGYLGTARTVEQSVHTGYHAWEQNDSEFRFFCLPQPQ